MVSITYSYSSIVINLAFAVVRIVPSVNVSNPGSRSSIWGRLNKNLIFPIKYFEKIPSKYWNLQKFVIKLF